MNVTNFAAANEDEMLENGKQTKERDDRRPKVAKEGDNVDNS